MICIKNKLFCYKKKINNFKSRFLKRITYSILKVLN